MWVKGSGGDLGTLTPEGLSVLRLDRLHGLRHVYRGVDHEDEMHELLDFCGFGPTRRCPEHRHLDARPARGSPCRSSPPRLGDRHRRRRPTVKSSTKRCFGDEVGWVPVATTRFQLAIEIETMRRQRPDLKGVVLGGHGLTAWGDTSEACEATSLELIARAAEFIERHGRSDPLGQIRPGFEPLEIEERRSEAAALGSGHPRPGGDGLPGSRPMVRRRCSARLHRPGGSTPRRAIGHVVPRPFHSHQSAAASPRPPDRRRLWNPGSSGSAGSTVSTGRNTEAYYRRMPRGHPADARRRPGHLPHPGRRHVQLRRRQPDRPRLAGEFYINAINVISGAEAVSTYSPCRSRRSSGSSTGCSRR